MAVKNYNTNVAYRQPLQCNCVFGDEIHSLFLMITGDYEVASVL